MKVQRRLNTAFKHHKIILLLFCVSLILNIIGITWVLPSADRGRFYPKELHHYTSPKNSGRLYMIAPYEPYHPDESFLLDALSNMDPDNLDYNPHFFNYGTLSIYMTGFLIKTADVLGMVIISSEKQFYINFPEEISIMYLLGRVLAAVMSAVGVALLYKTAQRLFDNTIALFSAIILAIMPLWVRDSHFMLVNIPAAVWMIACAYFAVIAIQQKRARPLLLSALMAGLATSTKYTSGAILPLTAFAFLYVPQNKLRNTLGSILLFIFGFFVGTPYALFSADEFLRDVLYEGSTKLGFPSPALTLNLVTVALGTSLTIIMLIGLVILARRLRQWQVKFVGIWLIAGLVQHLISDARLIRYIIPALPVLAILAGNGLNTLYLALSKYLPATSQKYRWAIPVLLLLPTLGYSLNILTIFRAPDVRTTVAAWVSDHIPQQTGIGVVDHIYFDMPPIRSDEYNVQLLDKTRPTKVPQVVVLTSETESYWGGSVPTSYKQASFSQRPYNVWTWPIKEWPHDWGYTFLDIDLFWSPETSLNFATSN